MRNSKSISRVIEIITALVVFLFVYTGIAKFREHSSFQAALQEFPLIASYANTISLLVPTVEIITALLLSLPRTRKIGFLISTFLLSIFTIYITGILLFTPKLPCHCGGVIKAMTWAQHMLFNIFFTGLSMIGFWLCRRNKVFIAINRSSRIPA